MPNVGKWRKVGKAPKQTGLSLAEAGAAEVFADLAQQATKARTDLSQFRSTKIS
jgi:hypothetical protein